MMVIGMMPVLVSCQKTIDDDYGAASRLVVEGWIEEGMAPVVMLTHAVDLTADTASFDGFVEKWARVSVYDGDTQYILTGAVNHNYMPEFIYTSSRLRGRAGHTYRLLVETDTDTLEAVATMPPAPYIGRLEAVKAEENDTLWYIRAYLDGVESGRCYKLFARDFDDDRRYYATFMGTFRGESYSADEGRTITRGIHATYDDTEEPFSHYFTPGSRVSVRACSMEPELYDFWSVYDSNISLSQNLFFTFAGNCPGNVRGGLGYWAAYGMSQRSITIPRR